jgi:hypothetical protein
VSGYKVYGEATKRALEASVFTATDRRQQWRTWCDPAVLDVQGWNAFQRACCACTSFTRNLTEHRLSNLALMAPGQLLLGLELP